MAAKTKKNQSRGNQRSTQTRRRDQAGTTGTSQASEPEQQQPSQRSLARREEGQIASRRDPFTLMRFLTDDLNRMAESFGFGRSLLSSMGGLAQGRQTIWSPQIEVATGAGQITVRADLPGLKKEDVRVEVSNDMIVLSGERKQEHEEKRQGYFRSERSYGSFSRAIPLPEGARADEANATFKDGVLEITVPVPEEKQRQGRQIQIQ